MYLKIVITFCLYNSVFSFNVTDYLQQFGYINVSDTAVVDIKEAIIKFQEYYNLPISGTLNNETLELMNRPRCGVADNPVSYKLHHKKWGKKKLLWYFVLGNDESKEVATKVFDIWQNVTNLIFEYSALEPDIMISFSDKPFTHKNNARCQTGQCISKFDGKGGVVAHAYYPLDDKCREVHLDSSEVWDYKIGEPESGKTSLFHVLLHEIGHTLGLEHSSDSNSIMYAFYNTRIMNLAQDDISAIQNLYGVPSLKVVIETNMTHPDLCQVKNLNTFLITSTHHLYIFYNNFVWILSIGKQKYTKPFKIRDFAPFSSISHIYQRPNGNLMIVRNNVFYLVDFPNFASTTWYAKPLEYLGIPKDRHINAIFNSYSGKTYVIYDNIYFAEINECTLKTISYGLLSDKFPGIPSHTTGAFRYTNGNIYFFKNNTYFEFNEFSNKLIRAGDFNLDIFGINCPNKGILEQMRDLLSKLTTIE